MRGGLVHHLIIIPAALSLLLLQGAAIGRAPTIFQNDWCCTRISNFFQSPIFRLLGYAFEFLTNSVCLRHRRYLLHALPRPHTQPHTHTTPLHAITLHSNLLPATPLHLIAISILAINCLSGTCRRASSLQPLRTELPSASTQPTPLTPANTQPPNPLATYSKKHWLYPPPPLTNERSSVGRAEAPHRLASRWYTSSIHSSNGLGCIV